jgi:hypothetical protein
MKRLAAWQAYCKSCRFRHRHETEGGLFLSHSSKNRRMASRMAAVLRSHGVPVWQSRTNLPGAQQWHDEIGAALVRCDWFPILLTPRAVASKRVKRELLYALRSSRYEGRIVPVNFRKCDSSRLSWTLDDTQAIDFTGKFDDGCRSHLRTWGLGYKKFAGRQARQIFVDFDNFFLLELDKSTDS